MTGDSATPPLKVIGRYALHEVIASGGMASVHFGRLLGPVGFARTVAIKRLHERLAQDPEFTSMFLDEARLAARIRHPNVIPTLDVISAENELFLVMEYVQGESLARLYARERERTGRIATAMLATLIAGVLHGLHAAHEAKSEGGTALGLIHRDVSPQNILVGVDGVARVLDFGVAKAAGRAATTRDGQLKGKLSYMAPEQLAGVPITRTIDIYAAGVVLWEGLAGRRLYKADSEAELVTMVIGGKIDPPSKYNENVSPELDAIVMRAVSMLPEKRFETAREMARALEKLMPPIPASEIGEWVEQIAGSTLAARSHTISLIERSSPSEVTSIAGSAHMPEDVPTSNAPVATPATPPPPAAAEEIRDTSSLSAASAIALPVYGPKGKRLYIIGAVLLALALVIIITGTVTSFSATPPNTASGTSASEATTAQPAPTQPPHSAIPPIPPPEDMPSVTASTSASAPAKKPPVVVTTKPPTPPVKPAAAPPNCDPPYVIDANGTRRYKRECAR